MDPPSGSDPRALNDAKLAVFRAAESADPAHYVRGQYAGYRSIDGVADDSSTETYVALRLEIDNWRWAGVPWFIRTGKRLPATQTEVRLIFRHPPRLHFLPEPTRHPEPAQITLRLDPTTGMQVILDAHRADRGGPAPIELDMRFSEEGGEGPTPYEVLLRAALDGDRSHFADQAIVEETWRIVQPLLDDPGEVHPYEPGTWGPDPAEALTQRVGGWHGPWLDA